MVAVLHNYDNSSAFVQPVLGAILDAKHSCAGEEVHFAKHSCADEEVQFAMTTRHLAVTITSCGTLLMWNHD